jgi:DNA-directed RNA polymerase specialized sigma24 family protein
VSTGHRDLRRRLRQGDRSAFDAVYAEHVDGGSWTTAEDVTSETFLTAWRSRALIADDDRSLRPWLWGIGAGASRPTYAWLEALPTEADELLDTLERSAVPVDGQEQSQATFELIGSLVSEQLVPPETAAALYRAVTRIPGVEVDRGATDALGRRGVGISRRDTRFHTRTTWVFDPSTYELLGVRWWFTHVDGSPDTLFGATAVLESAVVDRAGQVPGSDA